MELNTDILSLLKSRELLSSEDFSKELNVSHQKIIGAIKSLESLGEVISVTQVKRKLWQCTEEGELIVNNGSHEARLFAFIGEDGKDVDDIKKNFPSSGIALGAALRKHWIKKEGDIVMRCVPAINDQVQIDLKNVYENFADRVADKLKAEYKKRKLIKEIDFVIFEVRKGPEFTTSVTKQETELTKEMIESGQWKNKSFKAYNFNAKGKLDQRSGYLHPLMQLRGEFRRIFFEMGFTEMPTNNYIESAFWNFDALFQPQQHPARDAQDTFYIANPERTLEVPQDYLSRVRKVHEFGDFGSTGYRSPWSPEEAMKNLLRTHTTAVSARLLYKLAQDGFKPAKYFSIDKVYRNETLDATHLAEFFQVEGVIADYKLSMKHLMSVFSSFFEKIGIRNIRFKSAYNPYTEPSMEIFGFHEGLKKWVEVGNSGYFRPEMLRPMGLPEDVTVAGWGLSLERPAMIMYGINNIRELVGPRVKLDLILDNPVCTIDKFQRKLRPSSNLPMEELSSRQETILQELKKLDGRLGELSTSEVESTNLSTTMVVPADGLVLDVVVYADPTRIPYSLLPLTAYMASVCALSLSVHVHSSVKDPQVNLLSFWDRLRPSIDPAANPKIRLRLIWRNQSAFVGSAHPSLVVSPLNSVQVVGEANVCRFVCRLMEGIKTKVPTPTPPSLYEKGHSLDVVGRIDAILDACEDALSSSENSRSLKALQQRINLRTTKWLCADHVTLADVFLGSTYRNLHSEIHNIQQWLQSCSEHPLLSLIT